MRPYTLAEALALPYGIDSGISVYMDQYGPSLEQIYIQSDIAFRFSSYYVAYQFIHAIYIAAGIITGLAFIRRVIRHVVLPRLPQTPLVRADALLDKHVILAPTVGDKSADLYELVPRRWVGRWMTVQIPTRWHSFVVGVFNVANIVILFTPYLHSYPNIFWPDLGWPFGAYLRYFSDRTGIIAFGFTPLVILLAARNSVIGTISGASFSTLQIYHRWIARWTYIHAFCHGWGYTIQYLWPGLAYYKAAFQEPYFVWGCVALASGSALAFLSHRRLREIAYEVFVVGHIIAAVMWVVGCYYHVFLLPNPDELKYVYAMMAAWAFDRFLRNVRILWINLPRPWQLRRRFFKAEAQVHNAGEFLRLRVTPAGSWPAAIGGPGTFVYVSQPWSWRSWGSHPLTIAWPANMPPAPADETIAAAGEGGLDGQLWKSKDKQGFELIVKKWDGFTRELVRAASHPIPGDKEVGDVSGMVKNISLLIDGPYGEAESFAHLDAVVLIAGGSGITAMTARLADLARAEVAQKLAAKEIRLLWAIRDYHTRDVLLPYLQPLAAYFKNRGSGFLKIEMHVTGDVPNADEKVDRKSDDKRSDDKSDSPSDEADSKTNPYETQTPSYSEGELAPVAHTLRVPSSFSCTVHRGRPDVGPYLDEMRRDIPDGRIGVAVCGPTGFCDTAREAVRARMSGEAIKDLSKGWVFSEEAFSW